MVADEADLIAERAACVQAILTDPAQLKVIIAGPGTGKTYAFQKLLADVDGPALAITFLRSLVDDLAGALANSANVYTFHGFCRKLLHDVRVAGVSMKVAYYPALSAIQQTDVRLTTDLEDDSIDVEAAFMNLDDGAGEIAAALMSGDYYDAVGHTDSVYRVYQHFGENPDAIPTFTQVVVDEYQDFSLLEARLIDRLMVGSPTLIVGDDDQALYSFKHASPEYIRELAHDDRFKRFELPFCSRCTEVLVQATHSVVGRAQAAGLLRARVEKRYECFLPDKLAESQQYPRIIHAKCSVERNNAPYMGRYIECRINQIPNEEILESRELGVPTVLVVGPKQFGHRVYEHLQKTFRDVEYRVSSSLAPVVMDGYRLILKEDRSRLGWRILLECHGPPGWEEWVRNSILSNVELVDLIDDQYRREQQGIVELLGRVLEDEDITDDEIKRIEAATDQTRAELSPRNEEEEPVTTCDESNRPSILITSLLGAKGLQAAHVFVVGVNSGHFPRDPNAISDNEVCQLLVALTRARKSCTFVSCGRFGNHELQASPFLEWIARYVDFTRVDKAFFENLRLTEHAQPGS